MQETAFDRAYVPVGPVTQRFHLSDTRHRGLRGPLGGGKTWACIFEIIHRAKRQARDIRGRRRTRWAVIRNTYAELKTTTLKSWFEIFPQDVVGDFSWGPPATWTYRHGDLDVEVIFLALDQPKDIKRILGLEVTGAWVNEARQIYAYEIIQLLSKRCGRFPPMVDGGPTWYGMILDTNSMDQGHWWYRLAEKDRPQNWEFFVQPSGLSPRAENRNNLPPDYYDTAGSDPDWVRVFVENEYGFVIEGKLVFPQYREHIHVAKHFLEPIPGLPIIVGQDYGLTPAASFLQQSPRGQWRILKELVTQEMGVKRFAGHVKTILNTDYLRYTCKGWGDPGGTSRESDEMSALGWMNEVLDTEPAPTNNWARRKEAVIGALERLIDGEPGLIIDPRCEVIRKGFSGGYHHRRMQIPGVEMYSPEPMKNMYSHVMDSIQYGLLGGGEFEADMRPQGLVAAHARNMPTTADMDYDPYD